uniref:Uncharacterized protein n=1 Tax=Medicago truncatula TaxID=3880 RepID=A7UQT7_MEDTR|nr:hypothetical protein MtrDRAFT_AC152185g39v2 [Medicago truncatula]
MPFAWQAEFSAQSAFSPALWLHNSSTPAITTVSFTDKDFTKQTKPVQVQPKVTFAQALSGSVTTIDEQLLVPIIKYDSLIIKITQEEYEKGIDECKRLLHGRLVMSKGDKPCTAEGYAQCLGSRHL